MPIQQELIAAANKSNEFWPAQTRDLGKYSDEVPFPFMTTCLNLGASFSHDGVDCGTAVNPFYCDFDKGDNDDGTSVSLSTGFKRHH